MDPAPPVNLRGSVGPSGGDALRMLSSLGGASMLKRLILTTAMSLAAVSSAWAEDKLPVTGKTCSELLAFYKNLPFTSVLPLPDGPVSIPGKTGDITVGFSQTGFNHPWRTAMLAALQAEACRHPNIKIVVVDGNVDVAKQNK